MTVWPLTLTLAEIVSPGRTLIFSVTGAAGTISYQMEYCAWPPTQSASVPICSSAVEDVLQAAEAEPVGRVAVPARRAARLRLHPRAADAVEADAGPADRKPAALELVALRVAAWAGTAVAAKAATSATMAAVARRRLTIQRIGPGPRRT